jgi:cytochrome P450
MKFVWSESISQARAMLRYWTNLSSAGIPSVQRDIRTVSLNVLAAIAFRRSYNFRGSSEPSVDDTNSYRDALQTVLDGAIPLLLIPYKILASSWLPLPKGLARLGKAAVAYKKHMMTMLEEELAALNQGTHGSGGVMTAFVRALDVHNRETAAGSPPPAREDRKGLSVDEILGNLFVLNFAGHDTTANTLAFATLLLAAHPEVQDWLREEVRSVTKDSTTPEKWDYKTMYPQLKRCHAVFLETLRLYPPVMIIPKTVTQPQTLEVGKRTLTIPPPTGVSVSAMAVQTNPDFWGPDPLAWKPARWILNPAPADSSPPSQGQLAGEELLVPERNTFLAWSEGPQSCPGRKFSEVEATAVIASLFEGHRLTVKREAGESDDDARKRAVECVNDVNMEMLLKMVDADRVKLVCSRVD